MFKNMHPARLYSLVEAGMAAIAAFLPLSGVQVAAVLGFVAMAPGHQVTRKTSN